MKINDETIRHLQTVLADYVAESGEHFGKYLFSKELGMIENRLYSETIAGTDQTDTFEFEGELPVVDDPELLPTLEAV